MSGGRGRDLYDDRDRYGPRHDHGAPSGERPRMSVWAILAIVFSLLGTVFMSVSLALPWYSDEVNSGGVYTGVRWGVLDAEIMNETGAHKVSYEDDIMHYNESVAWLMNLTFLLVLMGIIFSVLLLMFSVLVGLGKLRRIIGVIFALLTVIFCIASPLALLLGMPQAYTQDINALKDADGNPLQCAAGPCDNFQGSEDWGDNGVWSWGGDWGWVVSWTGWVFALLAMISLLGVPQPVMGKDNAPPKREREDRTPRSGSYGDIGSKPDRYDEFDDRRPPSRYDDEIEEDYY